MHSLLEKLFKKNGIDSLQDLSDEERKEFDRSRLILSKEELTVKEIKEFCRIQLDIINGRWSDYNIDHSKKSELIPYYTVYNLLLKAIDGPKIAREAEEKRLTALLKD